MEILSGRASDRPRPPPGRRYFQRQASFNLSPSDMFLFRPPKPTYVATSWPGELCVLGSSVCLALERIGGASKVLLFCHGTSSDLGMTRRSLETLGDMLDCHVVGVEYPGYGLMAHDESNEQSVNAAVRVAFLHITEVMGWPADRVVVMGRSLGSGPAACLAREFQPGALFLLAPFTGVGDMAESIVGGTLASMFNLNQWDNKKEVAKTTCPTLVLHGLKDQVVPHTHSLDLYRASAATTKYVALLFDSDHNRIGWRVACELYAKPFMEMACPSETNRALGIRPMDVAKLSNFDPSGKATLILACAKAAWARRGVGGGTGTGQACAGGGSSQGEAASDFGTPSDQAGESCRPRKNGGDEGSGDGDGDADASSTAGWAAAAAAGAFPPASPAQALFASPARPRSGMSVLSTSVLSVSRPGSPTAAAAPPAAAREGGAAEEEAAERAAKQRISGDRTGLSFWRWGGKPRTDDEGGSGGGGGSAGGGGGCGGWGTGMVRVPSFEPSVKGSVATSGGGVPRGGAERGSGVGRAPAFETSVAAAAAAAAAASAATSSASSSSEGGGSSGRGSSRKRSVDGEVGGTLGKKGGGGGVLNPGKE
ncbi:unnamed protein product [Ectocarpus fasciculatus]